MWPKPLIPKFFHDKGCTVAQWTSWQWQLANLIKHQSSERITPYLWSLIDWKNAKDPIALQHLFNSKELLRDTFTYHSVWEQPHDFLDGSNRMLQQKYPDIAVVRITNTCHSFCRFCFEKDRTIRHNVATVVGAKQLSTAHKIIDKKKKIRQILLSGGDPSVLPDHVLKQYLEAFITIPHLKIIRINTRTLLHNPYRITPEFAKMLGELQKNSWKKNLKNGKLIHLGVHFNHPKELTAEALTAIRRLQSEGIHIYNQTVLLKNINDSAKILQKLFRTLRAEGVHLHYLSHAMAVPGTGHFRTTVRKGIELLDELKKSKEFRGQLPHYEMSHAAGKQIINGFSPYFYESMLKKGNKKQPIIRFLSDITAKWETYPDEKTKSL